jgi:hypothetical protein
MVYPLDPNVLGIIAYSADGIVDRLLEIDGVTFVEDRGSCCDLKCPALCLPDVTRVLVPRDSVRAPATLVDAACRGALWRNPLDYDVFRDQGRPSVGRPTPKTPAAVRPSRDSVFLDR